jgi:hypothetical protein
MKTALVISKPLIAGSRKEAHLIGLNHLTFLGSSENGKH